MSRTLSLRELRQNPTDPIDAVEDGEVVVITRHGRPIADLVPHARRTGATLAAVAEMLERTEADPEWGRELRTSRSEPARDVWGDDR